MRSLHPQRPTDDHATEHVVTFDIETIVDDEPADGSFPPWPRHKPVAAAFLRADWDDGRYRFGLKTLICRPGEEAAFYDAVNRQLPAGITSVSFNGRGFDEEVRLAATAALTMRPSRTFSPSARPGSSSSAARPRPASART